MSKSIFSCSVTSIVPKMHYFVFVLVVVEQGKLFLFSSIQLAQSNDCTFSLCFFSLGFVEVFVFLSVN